MKKKQIEKIPYLTLPQTIKGRTVKFVGRTAVVEVGGKDTLFLEVYENKARKKKEPVCRVVINKNDYGTYFPADGIWTKQVTTFNEYTAGPIWEPMGYTSSYAKRIKEYVLYSAEDLIRIHDFFDVRYNTYNDASWWNYFGEAERSMNQIKQRKAQERRWQKRRDALKARSEALPEYSEEKVLEYADKNIFHNKHYLYYKKYGVRAKVCCSSCGGVAEGRWKQGESYESLFERSIEEPRAHQYGICPMCGARGEYMAQGRMRPYIEVKSQLYLGQKYKDNGFVLRYFDVFKEYQLELQPGDKGDEMFRACEIISGVEIARTYYVPGEQIQTDYHKRDPYVGGDFWDDCDLSGMAHIQIRAGAIMPETYKNMKGTAFEYCQLDKWQRMTYQFDMATPREYMKAYLEYPQIEMLVKMNLKAPVEALIAKREYQFDIGAKRPEDFLRINKDRIKDLMTRQGDENYWKTYQMERASDAHWTDEQISAVAELGTFGDSMRIALRLVGVQKALNYIQKAAGASFGTECSKAIHQLRHTAQTYVDYLDMRAALGYDMTRDTYLRPRNLEAAHTKMINERDKNKADMRLQEVAVRFPNIKKSYRKLRNRFFYEDGTYCIRPARKAEEIVQEGRILHHCVGGDGYLGKHDRGDAFILFLRFVGDEETPYITVEISKELRILQWYGAHDKKPDEKNMQQWLNQYVTRLKCQGTQNIEDADLIREVG